MTHQQQVLLQVQWTLLLYARKRNNYHFIRETKACIETTCRLPWDWQSSCCMCPGLHFASRHPVPCVCGVVGNALADASVKSREVVLIELYPCEKKEQSGGCIRRIAARGCVAIIALLSGVRGQKDTLKRVLLRHNAVCVSALMSPKVHQTKPFCKKTRG